MTGSARRAASLVACRLPFGTIWFLQAATLRLPAQPLRCSAPWRLPARIVSVRRAPRRAAVLVKVMAPVQTVPIAAFECSSQPPTSECCDDRLNPPAPVGGQGRNGDVGDVRHPE